MNQFAQLDAPFHLSKLIFFVLASYTSRYVNTDKEVPQVAACIDQHQQGRLDTQNTIY